MMCILDIFRSCLILRHRRSHDITVVPSKDKGGTLGPLTRSSSTTSILSCTIRKDDLPPLGTLQPRSSTSSTGSSQHGSFSRPVSAISSLPPTPPALPARPASIAGLPSIPETPVPPPLPPANPISGPKISPQHSMRQDVASPVPGTDGVTIIEVQGYAEPVDAYRLPEEPQYSEPLVFEDNAPPRSRGSQSSQDTVDLSVAISKEQDGDEHEGREEYPYQDIYEEIRQLKDSCGKDQRDEELPDVVTSAYASGEQVYQELLDLVKEEEIKDEKRRSQQLILPVQGDVVITEQTKDTSPKRRTSDDILLDTRHPMGSIGSSAGESLNSNRSSSGCSGSGGEERDSLDDLYAVPRKRRNKNKDTSLPNASDVDSTGPRLPPRRVKSSYTRDLDWAPKVPEKSSLLRRSLSDAGGPKDDEGVNASADESNTSKSTSNKAVVEEKLEIDQSLSSDSPTIAHNSTPAGQYVQIVKVVHGRDDTDFKDRDQSEAALCPVYEELQSPRDRLI